MRNIISFSSINRFVLCCTLGTFSISTMIPFQAAGCPHKMMSAGLSDINFGIRVQKLIEKSKKYFYAKDSAKLTDTMFKIKNEIEGYTGQKISIEGSLDKIEREAKARGKPIDKMHMKEMRRRLKKQEKRHKHKALYMAACIENDLSFNAEEEELMYENSLVYILDGSIAKRSHDKDKDEKEIALPLRVTVGITMALVGLFLYVVPFQPCRACAPWVLETGIAFLIDQSFTEWENNENDNEKNKTETER